MNEIAIARAFKDAGFELFLVGGSVRDKIMGVPSNDEDYCTNALPSETANILGKFGKVHRVGEKFGTIGLDNIEVTTFRTDQYANGSRKPVVEFGTSLLDDQSRRDFCLNSIAFDELTNTYFDPFNGKADIDNQLIRCVGSAEDRFKEDPLRMLRAIRFACRLGFSIEDKTYNAIRLRNRSILSVSKERVQEEFSKIVLSDVRKGLMLLKDTGLLSFIAPELMMLDDPRTQGKYHNKNVFLHTMNVVEKVQQDLVLRLAALMHDIGKMPTRTEENGEVHYYGHDEVGAILAESILKRLHYSNDIISRVCKLIRCHMQVNYYVPSWTDGTVKKLMDRLGDDIFFGIELARYDQAAHKQGHSDSANDLERRVIEIRNKKEPFRLPINGKELMERYNRSSGMWVGEVKDKLMQLVYNGELDPNDKERAFEIADTLV